MENYLYNCKTEFTFAVDKLTYGEHPKLIYRGSEIEVHTIFVMLVPEAPGHLYTELVYALSKYAGIWRTPYVTQLARLYASQARQRRSSFWCSIMRNV